MRQLLSLRLVAALVALGLLTLGVNAVFADDDDVIETIVEVKAPPVRRVDLIATVEEFDQSEDFEVSTDGTTVGFLDATLGPERVMRIAPGTPGEISCSSLRQTNRCVVLADMLGEAVVWFAILPRAPRDTAELPPIVDLQDGYALFDNGWQILYTQTIERDCDDSLDIRNFSDFLRRFGPDSVTVVDVEMQRVATVRCGAEAEPVTGTLDTGTLDLSGSSVPEG